MKENHRVAAASPGGRRIQSPRSPVLLMISPLARTAFGVLFLMPLVGCTAHKDVQYFSVVDEFGHQAFYRVRIQGGSAITKYKLQSGNFSAAAVEIMHGQMPDIPELGLDIEHERIFDETVAAYHMKLLDQAYAMTPDLGKRARWLAAMQQVDDARRAISKGQMAIDRATALVQRASDLSSAARTAQTKLDAFDVEKDHEVLTAKSDRDSKKTGVDQLVEATAKCAEEKGLTQLQQTTARIQQELDEARAKNDEALVTKKTKELAAAANAEATAKAECKRRETDLENARKSLQDLEDVFTEKTRQANETKRRLEDEARAAANLSAEAQLAAGSAHAVKSEAQANLREQCFRLKQHYADAAAAAESELDIGTLDCTADDIAGLVNKFEAHSAPPVATGSRLLEFGKASDPGTIDNALVNLSRLAWYASLSKSDLVSIGQMGNNDPYVFRKHVIWVSATNLNLQDVAGEIDRVIGNVVSIARTAKAQANQRAVQHQAKRSLLENLLGTAGPGGLANFDAQKLKSLVDVLLPETAGGNTTTDALGMLRTLRESILASQNGGTS